MSRTNVFGIVVALALVTGLAAARDPVMKNNPAEAADTQPETSDTEEEVLPRTVDQAVLFIVRDLPAKDKNRLRAKHKDELSRYHHGWGTEIRNSLGLWGGNPELLEACSFKLKGKRRTTDPDSASMVIIEEVWAYLINNPAA